MALIAMALYDPPGQSRHELLDQCLDSLFGTVDGLGNERPHRLILVSNGISEQTKQLLQDSDFNFELLEGKRNLGTAKAINRAWHFRYPGEHCVKMDPDVILHERGWLNKMEECLAADPSLGILGLKRRDLLECPTNPPGWTKSDLIMLPHQPGQKWFCVEKVGHVMGTCQIYRSELLDKMGYLVQFGPYGFDDSLAAVRCQVAGFYSAFLCNADISHIDLPSDEEYVSWKQKEAGRWMDRFYEIQSEYRTGQRSIYHGPDEELQ